MQAEKNNENNNNNNNKKQAYIQRKQIEF